MGHITQHKITTFYNDYGKVDVTFNSSIIASTGLIPGEVFLKVGSSSHHCILNSTSMMGARIIIQANDIFFEKLNEVKKKVSLRLAFKRNEKSNIPLSFFIKSKIESFNPLAGNKPNLYFLNLDYLQKPPDDLIEILGMLLDVHANAKRRKGERILLSADVVRRMKMKSVQGIVIVGSQKQKCVFRDLSFFGIKAVTSGKVEVFADKEIRVLIQFLDENLIIAGKTVRCEPLKERPDLLMLAVEFSEGSIPMHYTKTLSDYLEQVAITSRGNKDVDAGDSKK